MPRRIKKEDFIRIWEESETRAEAAEKMGLQPESCTNRARFYRKKGISLKQFPGHRQKGRVPAGTTFNKKKNNEIDD